VVHMKVAHARLCCLLIGKVLLLMDLDAFVKFTRWVEFGQSPHFCPACHDGSMACPPPKIPKMHKLRLSCDAQV
jgi:hypothetical protein